MKIDKMRLTKNGYIAEYKYKLTYAGEMSSLLREIKLTGKLALPTDGTPEKGIFKAGNIEYKYSIHPIEIPKRGLVHNIYFAENKDNPKPNERTGRARENYIKILDTMYKIINDFINKNHPEYLGISSRNESNYYSVYDGLWRSNSIEGYMRVNAGLPFVYQGEDYQMMLFKKKQSL